MAPRPWVRHHLGMKLGTVLVMSVAACSSHDPPAVTPPLSPIVRPPAVEASHDPAAETPPLPPVVRPPAAESVHRLTQFDVDLELRNDTSIYYSTASASLNWPGCWVEVAVAGRPMSDLLATAPRVARRVGTLDLVCVSGPWAGNAMDKPRPPDPKCLEICDHMRPSPDGTAEDRYPAEPPVIELEMYGGMGGGRGGARVWSDGTIQFFGSRCPAWRGRRVAVPAKVATDLVQALDHRGFFTHPPANGPLGCTDAIFVKLTARDRDRRSSIESDECRSPELGRLAEDLQRALGPNPCSSF